MRRGAGRSCAAEESDGAPGGALDREGRDADERRESQGGPAVPIRIR